MAGIVSVSGNLIYGMAKHMSYVYAITSVAFGAFLGYAADKKVFDHCVSTLSAGFACAFICTAFSMPLNIVYFNGKTGNLWGDGVLHYLGEQGFPQAVALIAGEFYIEILDKILVLLLFYLLLRLIRLLLGKVHKQEAEGGAEQASAAGGTALTIGFVLLLALAGAGRTTAYADQENADQAVEGVIDYRDYVQTIYSSNNGLPCGEANDIAQTGNGILWIGTYAGLYRYNGREFRWMDNYDSVRNVNCLYVDEEGRLWIGTNDNGLSICINEKIVNVIDQSSGLPSNSVRCITCSSDGLYYVGTTSSMQLLSLNGGLQKTGTIDEINYADAITADDKGNVVTITSDGKMYLLKDGEVLSRIQLGEEEEIFNACGFDNSGRLFAGSTLNRIHLYDISAGKFQKTGTINCAGLKNINDLYFLENGEIFISADTGIGYLDAGGHFHSINVNSFNNSIDNMLVDYQGNLWFTSSRLGLLRLSSSPFRDVYTTVGMQERVVNTITKWQGKYYFGTDKGLDVVGADCRRRADDPLQAELEDVRIRCMYTDSAGHLWICTYGQGLIEVDPEGKKYRYNSDNGSFGNRARLVTELRDGTIVAAGDTGMSFIRDHEILRTIGFADGLINSMILSVTEMEDGSILAGTDGDGIAVIEDGEVTSMLTRYDGLSSEVILRTVKDPKAEAVFIVTSNGLCYMDETGSIRPLNNFPYFNNYDIYIRDQDTLFVTSSAGIYVVNRGELLSDKQDISYELLDSHKGLNSALTANSWNYCNEAGDLFLACDTGVFIIDTERYSSDTHSYRMSISDLYLDGVYHRAENSEAIRVGRGISKIEIYPEIINYTIQDPYVGYYLEGFEPNWNILPQSSLDGVTYTNLPTGEYIFHIAVFDSNKEKTIEERSYPLIKAKEIYDNHWFRVYMLVIAFAAVIGFTCLMVYRTVQRTVTMQRRELALAEEKIRMGNETIVAIAKAVDAKDLRTAQHSQRVSEYAVLIGRELGYDEKECENLRRAALTHDIGKIGIPDSILNKPARLTDEEYGVMKSHTVRGAEILKDFTLIDHVVEGAQYHHERYDGRGYPAGLKGEEIPEYGRIIGVADAFDAMTANRVYRKQMDFAYVLGEMERGKGTQFDPKMVEILLRLIDEGKIDLHSLYPEIDQDHSSTSEKPKENGSGAAGKKEEKKGERKEEKEEAPKAEKKEGGAV